MHNFTHIQALKNRTKAIKFKIFNFSIVYLFLKSSLQTTLLGKLNGTFLIAVDKIQHSWCDCRDGISSSGFKDVLKINGGVVAVQKLSELLSLRKTPKE